MEYENTVFSHVVQERAEDTKAPSPMYKRVGIKKALQEVACRFSLAGDFYLSLGLLVKLCLIDCYYSLKVKSFIVPWFCICSYIYWPQNRGAICFITTTKYQGVDVTLAWLPISSEWYVESLKAVFAK